jgi:hypothetical protein
MRESVVLAMQSAQRAQLEPAQAGVCYDIAQYKDLSNKGDDDGVAALRDTLLRQAVDSCKRAETYAAQGNNSFASINDALTNFQIELNRQINQCQYEADQAIANAEQKIEMTDHYYEVMTEFQSLLAYMAVFMSWYR